MEGQERRLENKNRTQRKIAADNYAIPVWMQLKKGFYVDLEAMSKRFGLKRADILKDALTLYRDHHNALNAGGDRHKLPFGPVLNAEQAKEQYRALASILHVKRNMSPEQASDNARKAACKRWDEERKRAAAESTKKAS